MKEVWKDIECFEGYYKISSRGQLYSFPRKGTKGGYSYGIKNDKGYLCARLIKEGKQVDKKMHILVYETFVGSIPEGYDVHHINHNKQDNRVENLELILHSKHSEMHFEEKKEKVINGTVNSRSKPVLQYTIDGEFVAEYKSATEAQRQTGICQSDISACCRNKSEIGKDGYKFTHRTAGGYVWKFKNNDLIAA